MRHALILACVLLGACSHPPAYMPGQDAHWIAFTNGTCSATAVGPHVILTAAHCLDAPLTTLDGKPVRVMWIAPDGHDHALIGLDHTFRNWARIGTKPVQGERVYVDGNPGDERFMFRAGWVAGSSTDRGQPVMLYELPIYFGDSGAGLFDSHGRLVAVVSGLHVMTNGVQITFGMSIPLAFTAAQWGMVK